MRRRAQQDLALGQRLAHEAELIVLQIAQPAVDQLAAGRGSVAREVVLLAQHHGQAPADGVTRNAGAIDPAADDQEIDRLIQAPRPHPRPHGPIPPISFAASRAPTW